MEIKLTKGSENKIMNWHAGCGFMYLSDGRGNSYSGCDISFRQRDNLYLLSMGNSKCITLTSEQIAIIGCYAKEETE